MAEIKYSYSLDERLDKDAVYLLNTNTEELRKIDPRLIKAGNLILAEKIGSPAHKAGEEAINTLEAIVLADRLYGESAAVDLAACSGYNFRPLLDVMRKDADALGLESGKLHEIYQNAVENKSTELHRLVAEMAPYNEILDSAKKANGCLAKSSAKKIHDFDIRVQRKKREKMRKALIPMLALGSAVAGGLPAAAVSLATLSGFSYGREAIYRLMETAGESELPGKVIKKIESGLNTVGFSIPYGVILAGEKAVGIPVDWSVVALYTIVMQGAFEGGKRAMPYVRKTRAVARTMMKTGWEQGKFLEKVKENEAVIDAESQLQKAPDQGKQGWLRKGARYFSMMKFPLGKRKYVDLLGLGVRDRLDEKEVLEIAQKEFESEFRKRYSPKVCYDLMNEYLPLNSKVNENELNRARGVMTGVVSTTITKESYDIRPYGGSDYTSIAAMFCEWGAENRIKAIRSKGTCEVQIDEGIVMARREDGIILGPVTKKEKDITAIYGNDAWSKIIDIMPPETKKLHEPSNGVWSRFGPPRTEHLVVRHGEKVGGTVVGYIEEGLRDGNLAQFPKLRKTPDGKPTITGWDLHDYEVHVSDMLERKEAVPLLYHEALHVANRLEAFEILKKIGYLLLENEKRQTRPSDS